MSSRSTLWQSRWQLDHAVGLAVHDSGLRVTFRDGGATAENGAEIAQSFIAMHGPHNAPAMVQRLIREGTQLLIDPHSRGWRGRT